LDRASLVAIEGDENCPVCELSRSRASN